MNKAIGGYIGLELRQGTHYHANALPLNTGRNCFEYILKLRGYKHVLLPYYTCEVMLEPLRKLGISYSFYAIDPGLEPATLPVLHDKEAFVYTNYYGLKQHAVEQLAKHYGPRLIVDNSQAFFAPRINGIDTFYSARKFFGVADGAYVYADTPLDIELPRDESCSRMSHLLTRIDTCAESGYGDYLLHEEQLCNQPIKSMSRLTEHILCSIDYEQVRQRRITNYMVLERALHGSNKLSLDASESVPMVYPYWTENGDTLRDELRQQRIYIAKYWKNVLDWNSPALEQSLANDLLALPVDQRYTPADIETIIPLII